MTVRPAPLIAILVAITFVAAPLAGQDAGNAPDEAREENRRGRLTLQAEPSPASAVPIRGNRGFGADVALEVRDEIFSVGGHANIGFDFPLVFSPSASIGFAQVFDETITLVSVNGDVFYPFDTTSPALTPYAGGGLAIFRASVSEFSESDLGLNLFGGAHFPTVSDSWVPFGELRFIIGAFAETGIVLRGGVTFY